MDAKSLQLALFKQVKDRLPGHLSLAEELGNMLGVSTDSAYRRIRGEKLLDIGELEVVAMRFGLSVDAIMANRAGGYVFSGRFIHEGEYSFEEWLSSLAQQLEMTLQGKEPVFIFQAKDIPLFHHFQFPELMHFKFSFWMRTVLHLAGSKNPSHERFDLDDRDEQLMALGRKVYLTYERLPSTEIWNAECLVSTLRQINYYRETGAFVKEDQAQRLFDMVLEMLDHLEHQAAAGVKFSLGESPGSGSASYMVHVNEVLLGDNAIYAGNERLRIVYLNHTGINYIGTTDEVFCEGTFNAFQNIIQRSTLISATGEKERKRFFNYLRAEVERRRH
ncbi:MAG: hypothetical protein JNM31_04410 [Flavobacteriales bacterium]|nr:hypothetical protein [Flavobacteriales bacterium]